ncbi:MAG: flagellar protein FlgN [Bacillota bacterium]
MPENGFKILLDLLQQELAIVEELKAAGSNLIRALKENVASEIISVTKRQEFLAGELAKLEEKRLQVQQDLINNSKTDAHFGEVAFLAPADLQDAFASLYNRLAAAVAQLRQINETGKILLLRAFRFHRQLTKLFATAQGEMYDPRGFLQKKQKPVGVFDRQV